ncbi:MAG: hypothetical protein ACM3U2_16320 [Deltaproteobacteria bacterium]
MNRRVMKWLTTGVMLLCLGATTAWAGLQIECFSAHLDGVDGCGNLICLREGGQDQYNAHFVALVNTCTGQVTGTATGCVPNYSCRLQIYINNCCFGYIEGVCVCSSLYTVYANGNAVLVATGHLCNNTSG